MKNLLAYLLLLAIVSVSVVSCGSDEDPEIPNEEEVITTLVYTLTSSAGDVVEMRFTDLDGDGGDAPVITGGTLAANSSYAGALTLLNEAESPSENITEEIEEEDEEHQFFFASTSSDIQVAYADADADNNPIGLSTTLTTGAAGSATLTITLRHEPNKAGSGVSDGDITNAGGETDIEVSFPVTVQ